MDILIHNARILTMDKEFRIIEQGTLAVKDGIIADLGPASLLKDRYQSKTEIDGNKRLLMPGLVNAHTHAAMTCLRGIADDLPLEDWLQHYIFPIESRFLSPEFVKTGTLLAAAEMIRSGTTLFNDMYYFTDQIVDCCEQSGVRGVLSGAIVDFPTPEYQNAGEAIRLTEEKLLRYTGHPLVTISVAPHAIYTCCEDTLRKAKTLADKYQAPLHIHLSETRSEFETSLLKYGETPVGYLEKLGLLDERTLAAHMVHLTEEDHEIILRHRAHIAHLPESNLKLVSGICPFERFYKEGVCAGLGTDGVASNNNLDLFEEMQTAAFMAKTRSGDPVSLPARSIVESATIGGARALGLAHKTGSLEIGKEADFILINLDQPHLTPLYDVYSHIVYAMRGSDVETVAVRGKILMRDHTLLTLDEYEIMEKARSMQARLMPYAKI